jgi:hypothetical protein
LQILAEREPDRPIVFTDENSFLRHAAFVS